MLAGLLCSWLACVGDEAQLREEEPPPPPGCPPERTSCSGVCVDTLTDAAHCGECDAACEAGETCDNGTCELCTDTMTICTGACVDTMVDPNHCGGCDMPCVGQLCVAGSCQPARDCKELHAYNTTLPDGVYDLDPEGDGDPYAAYCDM
ncbi:MAG TPA: fibrinogen-like YCDxxxxGGGW domain-containing protein, partial [Polyangiaceae bacterium]|nr:fibrinogen-like YCDxxxxGGGW domain-containing protein [Polyangiaceae bacterium]